MLKIFFLICIPVLVFVSFEYSNISLFVASRAQNMGYYLGSDDAIVSYNEAVWLARDSHYNQAKSLLQSIVNNKNLTNPADVYELYGDLVYKTYGSTGDMAVFYNRSLEYSNSWRVHKKLELLGTISPEKQNDPESPINTGRTLPSQDMTGAVEREIRRQELMQTGSMIQDVRDLSAGMIEPRDIITRTLDILATGSSIPKDW